MQLSGRPAVQVSWLLGAFSLGRPSSAGVVAAGTRSLVVVSVFLLCSWWFRHFRCWSWANLPRPHKAAMWVANPPGAPSSPQKAERNVALVRTGNRPHLAAGLPKALGKSRWCSPELEVTAALRRRTRRARIVAGVPLRHPDRRDGVLRRMPPRKRAPASSSGGLLLPLPSTWRSDGRARRVLAALGPGARRGPIPTQQRLAIGGCCASDGMPWASRSLGSVPRVRPAENHCGVGPRLVQQGRGLSVPTPHPRLRAGTCITVVNAIPSLWRRDASLGHAPPLGYLCKLARHPPPPMHPLWTSPSWPPVGSAISVASCSSSPSSSS